MFIIVCFKDSNFKFKLTLSKPASGVHNLFLNISGLVGLSLVYAIQLFNGLEFVATRATEVENTMTSVERVIEYSKVESEPGYTQQEQPPKDWPHEGNLRFLNVSQVYNTILTAIIAL